MGVVSAIAAVISTGISTQQAVTGKRAATRTRREGEVQAGRQAALLSDVQAEEEKERGQAASTAASRRRRAAALAGLGVGQGRQGTIRTGPLGIPSSGGQQGGKTLLGT